ncbi:acylphosphatase [Lacicoccus alkaliphilus]|uniref:D-alanine-D-alanine ligase n=1 Tax=Lacicoccus alkaliphilus DSM 16010 TaxID=1123231 RepID=A0A1M7H795_9BACL|nr:acylphosphatase [Salinicoccus alkaliphilus]SHM24370.1 D-alanine-D-alanine ligase [Salinicoccus alkaliphilus DSM 16010]
MAIENSEWLDHLKEAIPAEGYGNKLSMSLIALEAWRRGIEVKFYTIDNPDNKVLVRYSLEYGGRTHYFESSLGDKLSAEAFDVCEYKDLTKKYISYAGVRFPKGKVFTRSADKKDIINFASSLSFPVVVKPLDENAGKGVFSNVDSAENLIEIVDYLHNDLGYEQLLVEEYIPGVEYRILTVNGKVEGVVNRTPANITGNGQDDIETLIKKKNKSKQDNPAISKKKIKLDKEVLQIIENEGYTLESVLEEGRQLYLRSKSNISAGGDPIEITDEVPAKVVEAAEKATQSIPGLNIAGLDIIVEPETGEPVFIEINTKPMIGLHVFPIKGKARDVVKPIVDLYFPETKDIERSNLHFDFDSVVAPLNNLAVKHVDLEPLRDVKPYHTREYLIELNEKEGNFLSHIRLKALKSGVHGYIKKINAHTYQVVAATSTQEIMKDFQEDINKGSEAFKISNMQEKTWEKSVNIGFIIKKESLKELADKLDTENDNYKKVLLEKNETIENQTAELKVKTKTIEELQGEIETLQETMRDYKEKEKGLASKISKHEKRIQSLTLELGENERARISAENLLSKEKENAALEKKKYERNYDKLWKQYKGIVNSKSWKITKPLRKYNITKRNKKG